MLVLGGRTIEGDTDDIESIVSKQYDDDFFFSSFSFDVPKCVLPFDLKSREFSA